MKPDVLTCHAGFEPVEENVKENTTQGNKNSSLKREVNTRA